MADTQFEQNNQQVTTQYNADTIIINSDKSDPYFDYLQRQYQRIENFLEQTLYLVSKDKTLGENIVPRRYKYVANMVSEEQEIKLVPDPLVTVIGKQYANNLDYFDDLHKAFLEFRGRLLLLGEPGAGKTISLLLFARESILKRMKDQTQPLPILGIVPTWDYENRPSIAEWLQSSPYSPDNVAEIITNGTALLLLDGLDELYPKDYDTRDPRYFFVKQLPQNNQILLTCRTHTIEFKAMQIPLRGAVRLEPLTDEQISSYLVTSPHLTAMVRGNDALKSLLRNPIMLTLFAEAYHDKDEGIIGEKSDFDIHNEIIETCVRERYHRKETSLFSLEMMFEWWGLIVWEMLLGWLFAKDKTSITKQRIEKVVGEANADNFVLLSIQLRLFVQSDREKYRFSHLFFQDFLIYFYIKKNLLKIAKWDRGEKAIAYISLRLDYMGDAKFKSGDSYRQNFIQQCVNIILQPKSVQDRFSAAIVLSAFEKDAEESFSYLLKNPDTAVRFDAVFALGQSKEPFAEALLLETLQDSDPQIRFLSVEMLKEMRASTAIKYFLELLYDSNMRVVNSAAEAILDFDIEALSEVLQALSTTNNADLKNALLILNNDDEDAKKSIEHLLSALSSSKDRVEKYKTAIILSVVGDENLLNELIERMFFEKDVNENLSSLLLFLIAALGKKYPIPVIKLLNHSELETQQDAINLSRYIKNETILDALITKLASTNNFDIAFSIAFAIVDFGKETIFDKLANQMFDEKELDKLYEIGASNDKSALIEFMLSSIIDIVEGRKTGNPFLYMTLTAILGQVNYELIPVIIQSLSYENETVRQFIGGSIICMGEKARDDLNVALNNQDDNIRNSVTEIIEYLDSYFEKL